MKVSDLKNHKHIWVRKKQTFCLDRWKIYFSECLFLFLKFMIHIIHEKNIQNFGKFREISCIFERFKPKFLSNRPFPRKKAWNWPNMFSAAWISQISPNFRVSQNFYLHFLHALFYIDILCIFSKKKTIAENLSKVLFFLKKFKKNKNL